MKSSIKTQLGRVALGLLLVVWGVVAQQGGAPPAGGDSPAPSAPPSPPSPPSTPSPAPSVPSPTTPTRPPTIPIETQPSTRTPDVYEQPEMQRPIFLTGKVVLEDGTPPPEPVLIERVCYGMVRPEGYTDSKGRFAIQLGQNQFVFADASVAGGRNMPGSGSSPSSPWGWDRGGVSERELMGCEIRASLPGYHSDQISLAGRRALDRPDIGIIVLRRYGNVEGTTISATSLDAPKEAKKAFDKGRDAMRKSKWEDARKNLEKAVGLYPRYASAWFELGRTYEKLNQPEKAREAYSKSLQADARFLPPYVQLAGLAAQKGAWQEVVDTTNQLLRLDPFNFPNMYLFNAIANLNLRQLDAAEKSAREALRLDQGKRLPQVNHVLGVILAQKGDFVAAAELMRAYLKQVPNASNADVVRGQLARLEQLIQAARPQQ